MNSISQIINNIFRASEKKVRSRAGETIGETLVALLISSLALVMLAGTITAASSIIRNSKDKMDSYYKQNNEPNGVVRKVSGESGKSVSIKEKGTEENLANGTSIVYFKNEAFHIFSYRKE